VVDVYPPIFVFQILKVLSDEPDAKFPLDNNTSTDVVCPVNIKIADTFDTHFRWIPNPYDLI